MNMCLWFITLFDNPDTSLRSKANNMWWNSCFPAEPFAVGLKAITPHPIPAGRRCEPVEEDEACAPHLSAELRLPPPSPSIPSPRRASPGLGCQLEVTVSSPATGGPPPANTHPVPPHRWRGTAESRLRAAQPVSPPPVTPTRLGSCSSAHTPNSISRKHLAHYLQSHLVIYSGLFAFQLPPPPRRGTCWP